MSCNCPYIFFYLFNVFFPLPKLRGFSRSTRFELGQPEAMEKGVQGHLQQHKQGLGAESLCQLRPTGGRPTLRLGPHV